jgi:hypothetical protein
LWEIEITFAILGAFRPSNNMRMGRLWWTCASSGEKNEKEGKEKKTSARRTETTLKKIYGPNIPTLHRCILAVRLVS